MVFSFLNIDFLFQNLILLKMHSSPIPMIKVLGSITGGFLEEVISENMSLSFHNSIYFTLFIPTVTIFSEDKALIYIPVVSVPAGEGSCWGLG